MIPALLAYGLAVLLVGVFAARRASRSPDAFLLGDRSFGLLATWAALTSTTIGGSTTLVLAALVASRGLPGAWLDLSGALGLLALGIFLARRIRETGEVTLAAVVGRFYGERVRRVAATLVVLAPCGADLGEHGAGEGPPLHATVTRVPLLVRFPGAVRAGRVGEYVEIVDVPAMLLDVSGEPVPVHLHGRSPLPLIREEGKPPYAAFGESPHRGGQQFVALGGYRLIRSLEDGRDEVYHLAEDPLEERDVAVEERRRTEALAGHLAAWSRLVASSSLDPEKPPAPLDDTTLEKLKSLGYVQ